MDLSIEVSADPTDLCTVLNDRPRRHSEGAVQRKNVSNVHEGDGGRKAVMIDWDAMMIGDGRVSGKTRTWRHFSTRSALFLNSVNGTQSQSSRLAIVGRNPGPDGPHIPARALQMALQRARLSPILTNSSRRGHNLTWHNPTMPNPTSQRLATTN
jgi:hypothetical protein